MSRSPIRGIMASAMVLAAPARTIAAPDTSGPPAIIVGHPAEVRLNSAWFGPAAPTCVPLRIAATRPARLLITTSGLGRSRIARTGGGCPPGAGWRAGLAADFAAPLRFYDFAILVDPNVTDDLDAVEGEIVALDQAGGRAVATLKVNAARPSVAANVYGWFLTALAWFLGLLAPTLIGAYVAYRVAKRNRDATEAEAFDAFRELQGAKISAAVAELNIVFAAEIMEQPGQMAHDILSKHGILESLPRETRRRMTEYFRTNQTSAIVRTMKNEFPGWADKLIAK